MVVPGAGRCNPEQILVLIHGADNRNEEQQELGVFARGLPRLQQIHAIVGRHRPIIMFAAAVDPGKGLFVQQAGKAVARGDLFHHFHG